MLIALIANCGMAPPGVGLSIAYSGPFAVDTSGSLVTNQGAVASYTCVDQSLAPSENNQLSCVFVNTVTVEWQPDTLPTCEGTLFS